jgi:hypothetical protein
MVDINNSKSLPEWSPEVSRALSVLSDERRGLCAWTVRLVMTIRLVITIRLVMARPVLSISWSLRSRDRPAG